MSDGRALLALGGVLSLLAAVVHLACIVGGPAWYRALGAGERVAGQAEHGLPGPALMTSAIAAVLGIWGCYALAGARLVPTLPLMRPALVAISAVYLVRGLALFFPAMMRRPDLSPAFLFRSSAIVLTMGVIHAGGTWRAWPDLNGVS